MNVSQVWERVRQFALAREADQQPVFTNDKGVRNFITDVAQDSIGRRSDEGITNSSRVTRGEMEKLWGELNGGPPANILYFTRALLAAALPDWVEKVGGQLRLRSPASKKTGRITKTAMMDRIGATLTNVYWGWDAEMPDGTIVFIGWADQTNRSPTGSIERCRVFKYGSEYNAKPGAKERARHVEQLLATGAFGYLVIATPKDPDVNPRETDTFEEEMYTVQLERDERYCWARVVGVNSVPDIKEPDIAFDIQQIESSAEIPETEKPQLVQARRGQGLFRSRVELLEAGCRLTGVTDRAHLRAGHIKPWRDSTNAERLDGNNGLLLAPHVDHLFDRGFISFDTEDRLVMSARLKPDVLKAWGIAPDCDVGTFTAAQRAYLAYHRKNVFLS